MDILLLLLFRKHHQRRREAASLGFGGVYMIYFAAFKSQIVLSGYL